MKAWKVKVHIILEEFFGFSLVSYLILLLIENIKAGAVSSLFDMHILLAIVILSGIGMIVTFTPYNEKSTEKIVSADIQNFLFLTIISGLLVYYNTQDLGSLAFIITGAAICLISLITFILS
jgi:hypothetical protein